jgi:hypothetical protein
MDGGSCLGRIQCRNLERDWMKDFDSRLARVEYVLLDTKESLKPKKASDTIYQISFKICGATIVTQEVVRPDLNLPTLDSLNSKSGLFGIMLISLIACLLKTSPSFPSMASSPTPDNGIMPS